MAEVVPSSEIATLLRKSYGADELEHKKPGLAANWSSAKPSMVTSGTWGLPDCQTCMVQMVMIAGVIACLARHSSVVGTFVKEALGVHWIGTVEWTEDLSKRVGKHWTPSAMIINLVGNHLFVPLLQQA